jgi:hypothetical protein
LNNNDENNIDSLKAWHKRCKHLLGLMILIVSIFIWCPKGFANSNDASEFCIGDWPTCRSANIYIYAGLSSNPDTCANGLPVGSYWVKFDTSNYVHKVGRDDILSRSSLWEYRDWNRWWASQLTDETTFYCGIIFPNLTGTEDPTPTISDEEMKLLRGTLTLKMPALKFTILGAYVKVEPMHVCCSPEGEFVRQLLWGEECPEPTKSAGKTSDRYQCRPSDQTLVPEGTSYDNVRACCFNNGYCYPGTQEWCRKAKGTFMEDEKTCKPNPCSTPDSQGACHLTCPNDSEKECITTTEQECAAFDGRYELGGECPREADCPGETRGCCRTLPKKECIPMPPDECGMQNGVPLRKTGSCDFEADCQNLTGACMVGNECKGPHTKAECKQGLKGEYLGNGSTCESLKRACCDSESGECALKTKEECTGDKTFLEEVTSCEPNRCQKPKGGCCDSLSECNETAEDECTGTFFPDGCPAECPIVVGACYVPCPSSPFEICENTTGKNCKSFENSDFVPGQKCPEDPGKDCVCCSEAFGMWTLSRNNETADLVLNSDCTSTMKITKEENVGEGDLAIANRVSTKAGTWTCLEDIITVLWPDNIMSTLIMVWEGSTLKICYKEGNEVICAEIVPISVKLKKMTNGGKPEQ